MEKKIRFVRMPASDEALAPQAIVLLEVLKAKGPMTLSELTAAAKRRLKTCQTIPAIFNHYKKDLVKHGFLKVTKGGR